MLFFDNNGGEGAESNSQGVTNAQLFSRQVPSPIGLLLHKWCRLLGLNQGHHALQACALPTELKRHNWGV